MKSLITTVVFCFAVAQTQPTVAQAQQTIVQAQATAVQVQPTTADVQPTTADVQSAKGKKPTVTDILKFNGTVRAKYEYQPEEGAGRFEVRNCRISVSGQVMPTVAYKAEIDLSDEGQIRMLDAYVRLLPVENLRLTAGQMRVPFTIDAHRSPHQQYFANRSFIAKQVGNVRDVGATAGYTFVFGGNETNCRNKRYSGRDGQYTNGNEQDKTGKEYKTNGEMSSLTLEGGIFNGSGLTEQKHYWTKSYNYSLKAEALICGHTGVVLSCQHTRPAETGIMMWNCGAYWHSRGWHVEGEYLHKEYSGGAFKAVNAIDAFVVKRLPLHKVFEAVSLLGRYDYMDDHSDGKPDSNGRLTIDDPQRHRITAGATFHLGGKSPKTDIRLNYEKYFYGSGATPNVSERDKIVV